MFMLFMVSVFEAMFVLLLIPFLEIFGQSVEGAPNNFSYLTEIVESIFEEPSKAID